MRKLILIFAWIVLTGSVAFAFPPVMPQTSSGGTAGSVTVASETTDTSCFPLFVTANTGSLPPKIAAALTFNSNTGAFGATSFVGALTGTATGNIANTLADAAGDLIQGSADNTWAKLTKGAEGTILRAGASLYAPSTSTYADTYAIGTLLHASGANTVTGLGAGATGQILTGSTGAAPVWSATPSGLTSIAATTFTGALVGNASTVTVADADSDTSTWVLLGTGATGSLSPATDGGLTYNANTNSLTSVGGFVGALTGNADTATTATLASTVTVVDSTSATTWVGIFDTQTGSVAAKTDGGLTYNASTGVLTSEFSGPIGGTDATPSTAVFTTVSAGGGGFTVDADGDVVAKTLTTAASATPTYTFLDSDSLGADKEAARIVAAYVDGADGAENSTLDLYVMVAGTPTSYVQLDGKNITVDVVAPITMSSTNAVRFGDTGTYINQSADGTINIVGDTIAQIVAPNIKLAFDAAAYINFATADGGGTTISQVSDGTDLINIGDGVDDEVRFRMPQTTANGTWSGITLEFADCAASLPFGAPVYIQSTGKPALANATIATTMPAIGIIVVASTNADDPCTVLTHGRASATAWPTFTSGKYVYIDDSAAGVLTEVVGDIAGTDHVVQVLGIALSGDTILVNPSFSVITLE